MNKAQKLGMLVPLVCSVAIAGCNKGASDKAKEKAKSAGAASEASAAAPTNRKPSDLEPPADVATPPADAKKTAKGVFYKVLRPGESVDKPGPQETVEVNYSGWQTSGKLFDSSYRRGQSTTFPLNRVIAGWTDGLAQMSRGAWFRFWIPEELAYKGRDPKGMLVFDVELLDIKRAPKAPANVAAPPADAKKTASGLAYKVLSQGKGTKKPRSWDKVTVHYTGWTTDGKSFDSSKKRGQPASFPLYGVIPGWTEGLQLMSPGASFRFWIPKELAYNDQAGKPKGMLVFDIELISITEQPEPPPVPKDVAKAPTSAKTTKSGLAYRVIRPGKGASPKPTQTVEIHYTGWTTDGKMFDSTVIRGRPLKVPLARAHIEGWREGIALMNKGATYRFWIPDNIGLKGRGSGGTSVFDVELLSISKGPSVPPRANKPKAGQPAAKKAN